MEPSMLCLSWNDHMKNISSVFMEQLTTENLVDVTIICEGKFIKAHKMVLSACSPYLHEMLTMDNVPDPVIIMNNVKFSDMKLVIDFMYCGQITVSVEDFKNVVSLAQSLKIKGLSDEENVIEGFEACTWSDMLQSKKKRIVKMPLKGRGALRNKKLLMGRKNISTCDTVPIEIKTEPIDSDEGSERCMVENSNNSNFEEYQQWRGKEEKPDKVILDYLKISSNDAGGVEEASVKDGSSPKRSRNDNCTELPSDSACATSVQELSHSYLDNLFKSRQNNDGERIRRPPNAFMIFSSEWRKKLSKVYPSETSSGLCRRLGEIWNSLHQKDKQVYFEAARLACQEHKEKYPGYHYCPQKRKRNQMNLEKSAKIPKIKFGKVYLTGLDNLSIPVLIALNSPEVPFNGDKFKKRTRRNGR